MEFESNDNNFIQNNEFENTVYNEAASLSRPQNINGMWVIHRKRSLLAKT